MSLPTRSDVHQNVPLTNISLAYVQQAEDFISRRVFPVVPVSKTSDLYYTFSKNDFMRDEAELRGPNAPSAGTGFNLSTTAYSCKTYAIHQDVPWQVQANADAVLNLDRAAAELVTHKLMIREDRLWAANFFVTGVWGTSTALSGTDQFSDLDDSDPILRVGTAKTTIKKNTGKRANKIVVGYEVDEVLKRHPLILERSKYTSGESVSNEMLARLFDVDEYLVFGSVYASNVEGETAAQAFIGAKNMLVLHTTSSPSLMTPSAGYTFAWDGTGNSGGLSLDSFDIRENKATRIEGETSIDHKIVASDCGYIYIDAVA